MTRIIIGINPTTEEESRGAASFASVAKGLRSRHEKPKSHARSRRPHHGALAGLKLGVPVSLFVASTREPLLDGSRALLAAGHDPDTIAVMRLAWDQWFPSLRDPKMSWWPRSRKPPPVQGAHRATSRRHLSTAGRATAPVRRRFHPEEKTASPSPSVRPGGRTPNTLTRRLLGIGVTHVTAGPGCTGLRKKSPASRGAGRASFTQGELNASRPVKGNG